MGEGGEGKKKVLTAPGNRSHPELIGQVVAHFEVVGPRRKGFGKPVSGRDVDTADVDEDEVGAGGFDKLFVLRRQRSSHLLFQATRQETRFFFCSNKTNSYR